MTAQATMPSVDRLAARMRRLEADAVTTNRMVESSARLIRGRAAAIADDAHSLAQVSGRDAREALKQIEAKAEAIRNRFSN